WDADALLALAQEPEMLERASGEKVLTPHAGELARLLGCGAGQVDAAPLESARRAAAQFGAVVVLKGATTVIAHPDGHAALSTGGSPGMATAGSGDVLCGVIAAFLAQGLPAFEAACAGCAAHARAGELAAARRGMAGMISGDILEELPAVLTVSTDGT
ncbi:MAG: NAD(P)H-hydrate dehydratase, partial [Eubacteriales bacterium]|nr:NAD(P)H-hydrate dehydratase [Eubacteriales bacterium]